MAAVQSPITDISKVIEAGSGREFFAYIDGPDHALIEINTARDDTFQHVHFLSDDPVSTGQWYVKHFGAASPNPNPSREARTHNGLQIYPYMGANLDGVPAGVKVLQRPQSAMNGQLRSAFVQAPDGVELELVEGHAER